MECMAAPGIAMSPPTNGLRPHRKTTDLHREAFSRSALIKAILDQSLGASVPD